MARKPKNKKELFAALDREWGLLMKIAEALTDEQITTFDAGGWSPKDNLAHLTEWMKVLLGYHLAKRPAHKVLRLPEAATQGWNMEVINPMLFARNKNLSRQQVMSELKKTYHKVYAKLKATPFKDLLKPRHPNDPQKRPILLWVLGDTTGHFKEHRQVIQRNLSQQKAAAKKRTAKG